MQQQILAFDGYRVVCTPFFEPLNGIRDKRLGPSNKVWGKYSRFLICENRLPLMPTIGTRGPVCQSASAEVS